MDLMAQYFHCVEVTEEGKVRLKWDSPGNQADFVSYNIYRRLSSSSFAIRHVETDYNTTEFLDNDIVGNTQSNDYFIVTNQVQPLDSIVSDTLSSMHLTVLVISYTPYLVRLKWNPIHDPMLTGSDPLYTIWMNTTLNPTFFKLDSTDIEEYIFPLNICPSGVSFKVVIGNDRNCDSYSNTTYDVIGDINGPPMPVLDSVSIDQQTGNVILGWQASVDSDVTKYYVYNDLNNINDIYDTVFGRYNTSYVDVSFDPCQEKRGYAISAEDSCENIGPGTYDIIQQTILLNEVSFNPCSMVNYLSWTEYINMSPALAGYRLYLSVDGGQFSLLETLDAETLEYAHEGLDPWHNYQYFIRAFSNGNTVTSTSCIKEHNTWEYMRPVENNMENASVENSESVLLSLLPDNIAYVPWLNLYRRTDPADPWVLIDSLEPQGQPQVYYDDLTADVNSQSYYYYTSIEDSCLNEMLPSANMRTIFLAGESTAQKIALEWNAFEGWPSTVGAYEVYRAVSENGSFEKVGETGAATLNFEDNISGIPGEYSLLKYMVRALPADASSLYSESNVILFEYSPNVYLPNAFRPGGQNPVFKPVGNYADFDEYRLDIYNRWGELIFYSDDFNIGWDGSHKGSDAPAGAYVCIVNYRSSTGESTTLKSTFILLR